ncbi:MAG: spermidine synthase [Burkholderiales bacterium]
MPTSLAAKLRKQAAAPVSPVGLPCATLSEFDGVRYLHLGDTPWVQGAMRIRSPKTLVLEYVQRMMAWLLLVDESRWHDLHVVQLGLGAATLTRFTHGVMKLCTSAVEINPQVVAVCQQFFHLPPNNELLNVQITDAGQWVSEGEQAGTADVLQVDLYDHEAAAPALDDEIFYAHCHQALADGGVMVVNLFGRHTSFAHSARRVAAAFGEAQVRMLSPTKEGNTIVLARKAPASEPWPDRETMDRRAALAKTRWKLPAAAWPKLLRALPAERKPRAAQSAAADAA